MNLTKEQFAEKYRPLIGADGEFARHSFYSRDPQHRQQCEEAQDEGRLWTLRDEDGGVVIRPGTCAYPVEVYITEVALAHDEYDYVIIRDSN